MTHFITYVALERMVPLSGPALLAACRKLAEGGPFDVQPGPASAGRGPDDICLVVNGVPVVVMPVASALAEDAWAEAARLSIAWPQAGEALRRTQAHVIVALVQPAGTHQEALGGASAVTMVAGAVAALMPVAATIFTESNAIAKGADIVGLAANLAAGQVPPLFWATLTFLMGPERPDGTPTAAALTTGLCPFIGREIEFHPAPLHPTEIAQRLVGLVSYLTVNGPVIRDGETVGLSKAERIRARYADQCQRPGIPVLILNLETSDPALGGGTAPGGAR